MKVLFFILMLSFSAAAQQTDSVYCIQIMSTKNIDLVRAEHLTMAYDQAYVEQAGSYHRILIPYTSHDEAWFMLYTWKRAHKDAYITVRTKQQFEQHSKPFYTTR
jgi:hypothetical protein